MVRFNDRALIIGATGSGKSELINLLFAGVRCQRVLIDSKDEFAIADVEPVSEVEAIDWSQRTIHYVTSPLGGVDEFDDLFRAIYARRNVVTAIHELADVCAFNPNKTPEWFNAVLSKGRVRGLGLLMGTQRPVQVPVRARSESDHIFMVGERLLVAGDHQAVADAMGQAPRELAATIDRVQDQLGGEPDPQGRTHAYVAFTRAQRKLAAWPPIPAEHRRVIDVLRTEAIDQQGAA